MASFTVPDFSYLSPAEKTAIRDALLAEIQRRSGLGSIASGASQGQSVTMSKLSEAALGAYWNAINEAISGEPIVQARPVFTCPS
jgi:hypothetical protein